MNELNKLNEFLFIIFLFITMIIINIYIIACKIHYENYAEYSSSSCPPCICPICPTAVDPNRDYRVVNDPLYPPEQRSDYSMGNSLYNGYYRYPTRGYPPPYQMKGYLVDETDDKNIISIFGRPKYSGSTEYQYYVSKRDINNNEIKISISNNREIFDKDIVKIDSPIFQGVYKYVALPMEDLVQPPLY